MKKNAFCLILALCLIVSLLPFGALAADDVEEKTYPATRIGVLEMVYDLCGSPSDDDRPLPFDDLDGLTDKQLQVVRWAFDNRISIGSTSVTFSPLDACTNGSAVAFLHRAAGEPEPVSTQMPYTDIEPGNFYEKPVQWAVGLDLIEVKGAPEGEFQPRLSACSITVRTEAGEGSALSRSRLIFNMEHRWDDGVVKEIPHCNSVGRMLYTCLDCGTYTEENIPVTFAEWDESTLLAWRDATATSPGEKLYACKNCDIHLIYVHTPALGDDALARDFTDVPDGQYYTDPVDWAVRRGITTGTSENTFTPLGTCTRAQVVTFLWRAYGCPEIDPEDAVNEFYDVKRDAYYYDAVLWAVANGITNGKDAHHFAPDDPCTRAHVVTFLWRAEGQQQGFGYGSFDDVMDFSSYYFYAVYWANSVEITNGTGPRTFSPDQPCTRGQIVTFLQRAFDHETVYVFNTR